MKIDIERFGPINKFSYDLEKDIVVTYGNNNIGKSYSMQIVYLFLKTIIGNGYFMPRMYNHYYFAPVVSDFDIPESRFEKIVDDFLKNEEEIRDITQNIIQEVYNTFKGLFLDNFMNSCENTFGNLDKTLEGNPILRIKYKEYSFFIDLKEQMIKGTINIKKIRLKKTKSDFHKSRDCKEHLDIYVVNESIQPARLVGKQVIKYVSQLLRKIRLDYENVYFLPASRSGIYSGMNAFGSIVAELSKNRAYFTKKIEFPGISEPISDYFISLSNIKSKLNESLEEYYTDIEDGILKGKVTFDKNKNALMYKPHNVDAYYEMTEVSSMVSEVSPIVAFLKYVLSNQSRKIKKGKSILFIEEPEAHLHPNNQIALIEVFAKLIKVDVKLIISSHSNYVFNKLNNLVLGKELDYHVYEPIVLVESELGSVSKILKIDELGADDENFVDVSEKLYCEREKIIERLNMEE